MPHAARRLAGLSLIVLGAAACSLPGGGPPAPTLRIGVDLPLGGAEASIGIPALNGVRFFVSRHPTLDGYNVELVIKDDSTGGVAEPPVGAANVQDLASDPAVMGVIGPLDSSVARAEIPVANQAALAIVSPATSSPCLTRKDYLPAGLNTSRIPITCSQAGLPSASDLRPSGVNNFFRLATTDDLQGPAAADYAVRTLHVVRAAAVSDGEGYGQALATAFATRFRALGGSVVGRLDLAAGVPADAAPFLRKMKADGAQAVYYGGTPANRGCGLRAQMAGIFDAGQAAPMLGGDGIAQDATCLQDAGSNAAGVFATVPLIDAAQLGTAQPVIADFRAAYPKSSALGQYTLAAYDAAAVLYEAIHRALIAGGAGNPPQRGNVISQLSAMRDFAGVTGLFGFDAAGDTTRRVVSVYQSPATGPKAGWTLAGEIDYTPALPY